MFTSNFKTCWDHPNAVAISIGLPRGRSWKGKRYLALAPTREMLKMPSKDYDRLYREILSKLDPQKVAKRSRPRRYYALLREVQRTLSSSFGR